jgi:DNA-binding MarR family transcriptional regulator
VRPPRSASTCASASIFVSCGSDGLIAAPFGDKYLHVEIVCVGYLDVKRFQGENVSVERDHVDEFVAQLGDWLPDLDVEVEAAVERIQSIGRRLKREMEATLVEHGLTMGEWRVLMALYKEERHRRSPGALADACEISSGAMTNRIDRLEEDGLVRRLPDPDDRRGVIVEMTEQGRRRLDEATNAQARREAAIASALTDREKKQLNALLRKLMLAFEKREPKKKRTAA